MIKKLLSFLKDIKQVKRNSEKQLLKKKGVCGVGVNDNKIVVLVERKKELQDLKEKDIVPSTIEGFETKVIEVGEVTASVSGCPINGTACSVAGVCYKNGVSHYLQNSHCSLNSSGVAFVMPSPLDGGRAKDKVGVVSEQSEIKLKGNKVDALIAQTDIPQTVNTQTDRARIGDNVSFTGRTSGKRILKVIADDVTVNVNFGNFTAEFTNQIMLEGIVRGGDSGSGLMKGDKLCGLIFASNNNQYAFANHIQNVIDEMGITFSNQKAWRYFKPSETTNFKDFGVLGTISDLKPELVDMLDDARHLAQIPFVINSGYRVPAYNKSIGGKDESAHQTREAVDIRCRNSAERYKIITSLLAVGFKRIGYGKNFVHCDISKTLPQEVIWDY